MKFTHEDLLKNGYKLVFEDHFDNGIDDIGQLVTQENGYDGGWCFGYTQAMIIAGVGDSRAQKVLIFINTFDECGQEN